jgi:hypothetical protein
VSLSLLVCGVVCSRASWAAGGILVRTSPGAMFWRRAFPAALLVLVLLAWLASEPLLNRLSLTWIEESALVIMSGALLMAFFGWIALAVDRVDSERKRTEEQLHLGQTQQEGPIAEPETEARL